MTRVQPDLTTTQLRNAPLTSSRESSPTSSSGRTSRWNPFKVLFNSNRSVSPEPSVTINGPSGQSTILQGFSASTIPDALDKTSSPISIGFAFKKSGTFQFTTLDSIESNVQQLYNFIASSLSTDDFFNGTVNVEPRSTNSLFKEAFELFSASLDTPHLYDFRSFPETNSITVSPVRTPALKNIIYVMRHNITTPD